ncbi:MAG TPA: glycosyltransferase family 4 protein [Mycobacteriales bacterium]|nr:glycosyltransferase family 4 protein [Mycobacteriales bacterium]
MHVAALPAFANAAANRYNALLYAARERSGASIEEFTPRLTGQRRVDIVHVHWPDAPLNKPNPVKALGRATQMLGALAMARRRGARLVWTAHNAGTHVRRHPLAERVFWRLLDRLLDGWIALSPVTVDVVTERHPRLAGKPCAVIPHGHYRGAYPDDVDGPTARARLGLRPQDRVLAMVGRVKPYKGADELVRVFGELADDDARLLVAGRCDDEALRERLSALAAADPRVTLELRELADDELQVWLRAADVAVLPYVDVLNSGSALLALSYDLPVVAPAAGALRELAERLPGWVRGYTGPLTAPDLAAALDVRSVGRPDLGWCDWDPIAEQTLALFSRVATA